METFGFEPEKPSHVEVKCSNNEQYPQKTFIQLIQFDAEIKYANS